MRPGPAIFQMSRGTTRLSGAPRRGNASENENGAQRIADQTLQGGGRSSSGADFREASMWFDLILILLVITPLVLDSRQT
jgi:hypothetical protein